MNAVEITKIITDYKAGIIDYANASLQLVIIGLSSDEVIKLLS